MKKFRKSMKHKGLVSNPCSKSAPTHGFIGILPENLEISILRISTNIRPPSSVSFGFTCRNGTPRLVASFSTIGHEISLVESEVTPIFAQNGKKLPIFAYFSKTAHQILIIFCKKLTNVIRK